MTEARQIAQRYELRAVVGQGGMGKVWHAHDVVLGRDVAVKEILVPEGLSPEIRDELCRRTFREARACARLNHPNIVTIYDVVLEDGRPWMVMELLHARSVQQAIREDGPMAPAQAAEIGLRVLEALSAAHAIGILHRDVKPSNILLTDDDRVLLTDFGIAVIQGEDTITRDGSLVGSAAYLPPERWLGKDATAAGDLWSLGVTLYEAVEGKPPFHRPDAVAIGRAVLDDTPILSPNAGPLAPVIKGLLRKTPDRRPTSVAVMPTLTAIAAPLSVTRRYAGSGGTRVLPAPTYDLYPRGAHLFTCGFAAATVCGPLAALLVWQIDAEGKLTDVLKILSIFLATAAPVLHLPMLLAYGLLHRAEQPRLSNAVAWSGLIGAAAMLANWAAVSTFNVKRGDSLWHQSIWADVTVIGLVALAWTPLLVVGAAGWRRAKLLSLSAVPAFTVATVATLALELTAWSNGMQTALRTAQAIFYALWAVGVSRRLRSRAMTAP